MYYREFGIPARIARCYTVEELETQVDKFNGEKNCYTSVYVFDDAAEIDGATGVKAFWYITLPMIRNILIVAILITTIGAFKVFEFVYVLTQGGPSNATQVLGTYIYLQAFNLLHMGYANALSVVLLIIALILGWFQLKASRRA